MLFALPFAIENVPGVLGILMSKPFYSPCTVRGEGEGGDKKVIAPYLRLAIPHPSQQVGELGFK